MLYIVSLQLISKKINTSIIILRAVRERFPKHELDGLSKGDIMSLSWKINSIFKYYTCMYNTLALNYLWFALSSQRLSKYNVEI
jgi:hypothetical protein